MARLILAIGMILALAAVPMPGMASTSVGAEKLSQAEAAAVQAQPFSSTVAVSRPCWKKPTGLAGWCQPMPAILPGGNVPAWQSEKEAQAATVVRGGATALPDGWFRPPRQAAA